MIIKSNSVVFLLILGLQLWEKLDRNEMVILAAVAL
jgi:hypothetical protein